MQLFLVLATAGAVIAAVSESSEQKSFQQQAVDDESTVRSGTIPLSTNELEEYIEDVMERWHAPGVAVAIIQGGNTWTKVSFPGLRKLY